MDLEHTQLGLHCDVKDCHQRDFLPFTCESCNKHLCKEHRTYDAHSCNGATFKDMTSIDCPLCGKSVKFPKSEDVDTVWEKHYLTSCTQQMEKKNIIKCHEVSCPIILGPSNTILCGKCKQSVCLSHRLPEQHNCQGMRGAILSKLPINTKSTTTKTIINVPTNKSTSTIMKSTSLPPSSSSNTSKEKPALIPISQQPSTQKVPMTKPTVVGSASTGLSCPFCSICVTDVSILQNHIDTNHPDISGTSTTTTASSSSSSFSNFIPSQLSSVTASRSRIPTTTENTTNTINNNTATNNNARAREVCPVCNARFLDPIELVTHFETDHAIDNSNRVQTNQKSQSECALG